MQCVDETRQCLSMLKQKGCRILMMGCDLNRQLPPNIANITGGAVYNVAQVSHLQRVDEFLKLCNDYGLRVVNTFGDSPQFTRKSWGRYVFHTQIDYICVSQNAVTTPVRIANSEKVWRSDHSPVGLTVSLERPPTQRTFRKSNSGWKFTEPDGDVSFGKAVMTSLHMNSSDPADFNFSLLDVQNSLENIAARFPHRTANQRRADLQAATDSLRQARRWRQNTTPGSEERRLANKLARVNQKTTASALPTFLLIIS